MISFVRSEEVDELHQLRAELAMTAALVESLRRSAGADPSPEGAVKLPLYKQFVRSRRERERVSLLPAAGGDGTEDWWIAAITAANSASLSRGGHLVCFRGALKRAAPTRLTRAAGRLASILRVFPAAFWGFP